MTQNDSKFTYSDQRTIEYKLFELEPKIKILRLTFTEINQMGRLDAERRLFMFLFRFLNSFFNVYKCLTKVTS